MLPYTVAACPGCGARDITVLHPLCVCAVALPVFQSVCKCLPSQPWDRSSPGWLLALLGTRVEPDVQAALILAVARALLPAILQHEREVSQPSEEGESSPASSEG